MARKKSVMVDEVTGVAGQPHTTVAEKEGNGVEVNPAPDGGNLPAPKRKGKGNPHPVTAGKCLPNRRYTPETNEDRALVQQLLKEMYAEYKKPRVRNNDELMDRLDEYFATCISEGRVPTVEEMCLSIGYDVQQTSDWKAKRNIPKWGDESTHEILKRAWTNMRTFDAKLVIAGKINPICYFFRAKNYYGMRDQQEIVVAPGNPLGEQMSEKQLAERYSQGLDVSDYEDKTGK